MARRIGGTAWALLLATGWAVSGEAATTITITLPSATGSYTTTNATVNLAGTASDDVAVTSVTWTNAATTASGTVAGATNWTINGVALADGPNAITVRAHDGDGNVGTAGITVTRWTPAVNQPPVANAGVNQSVLQGAAVTLNGGASDDPDDRPSPLTYSWTQTGGPTVALSGATTATPSFTAPNVATLTTLTFRLTVSDSQDSDTDDVSVTVNPPGNYPPVANAGNDRTVTVGNPVTLSSTGSSDPDGTIVSRLWTQLAGPSVALSGANTATATFTPSETNAYTFRLTVTDDDGATGTDDVTITVSGGTNERPVADAGEDQVVAVGTTVALDGTGSSDPNGDLLAYAWAQLSGPPVTLQGANGAAAAFAAEETGISVFLLTVSDGALEATDTTVVVVTNASPASAGGFLPVRPIVTAADRAARFTVPLADTPRRIVIRNTRGRIVEELDVPQGANIVEWDFEGVPAEQVASGIYLIELELSDGTTLYCKITVVR